jgi:flagellin
MLSIASNVQSLSILNHLNEVTRGINHTTKVISSGKRIMSAKDDAAGMQIASRMTTQLQGFAVAKNNISHGQSILDVTSAGLNAGVEILQGMKDLALEAKNGTLTDDQRTALQLSFNEMQKQYDETIEGSSVFDKNLLSSGASDIKIQSGANAGSYNTLSAVDSTSITLGVDSGTINIMDQANSDLSIDALDDAMKKLGYNQAVVGAQSNSLTRRTSILDTMSENLTESRSRIEDADIGAEVSKLQLMQAQQQMSLQALSMSMDLPKLALELLR